MKRARSLAQLVACTAVLIACLASAAAQASFPGSNGRIAFNQDRGIYTVNPDGSDVQTVLTPPPTRGAPDWSPDGTKIAYYRNGDLFAVNPDGTGEVAWTSTSTRENTNKWSPDGTKMVFFFDVGDVFVGDLWVIDGPGGVTTPLTSDGRNRDPSWSPDGTKIAFSRALLQPDPDDDFDIWVMNADGSGQVRLTDSPSFDEIDPDWSPDGSRIAYSTSNGGGEVHVMDADGSNDSLLVPSASQADWSPDGTKLVYAKVDGSIYSANADGTNPVLVHSCPSCFLGAYAPDWQPIPINAYPRPKGATPFLTYLVPAYAECTAPNREHGPSLAFGSCAPPTQTSNALTIGSADSNGKPTKSVSSVRFDTVLGPPSAGDDADVKITAQVIDVYTQAGLDDYAGEVSAKTTLRITDKLNTPHPGGPGAGTVSDIPYGFTIPCAETADTAIGGECLLSTSADALAPGAVKEGKRSIWALGQVAVYDANGDPFMKQGIFVP